MNNEAIDPPESLLLDLHLRRLDPEQVQALEDTLASSPELAAQSRALRDVLRLLDRYETPEPPEDLADTVLARIQERAGVIPFPHPVPQPVSPSHDLAVTPVMSLREIIAIAACITLFIGVFVPGYYKARNIAQRNLCRDNQRQIWMGTATYAADHGGFLPWAGYVERGSWLPTRAVNVPRASNTRHFFTLLREGYIQDNNARVFLCPSAPDARPMLADNYADFRDFAEQINNTYSFIFMNRPRPPKLENLQKDENNRMPLAGDRNPFFDLSWAHRLNPYDDRSANSPTHEDGAGQNVIYATGSGGWYTNPLIGVSGDNIYRSGQISRYLGTERPTSATDSFIVP
ncbi:MAG: hypothetical protein AMXMBFR13_23820 [Phycisphaerae bacterium]